MIRRGEEKREKVWKIGGELAEAAIKGVKAGGKVEVTINVLADLSVTVTAREVGGKGGDDEATMMFTSGF
ncbi:hypothetical protein NM208_g16598 [Fusarium decemcellulare]|uniref:Uncharacterized protein n=1 Tax=Fusarium decemcellulare TaxID=57161 RepID=A0ACC1RBF5_9HYPO|nr:hypothetical protein NM208_g16598 [Fusarium decemcellulare]